MPARLLHHRTNPYDVLASLYAQHFGAESVRTLAIYDQLVLDHLSPDARILDVCCGTGQLAADLSVRGFRVTGIDNSRAMLVHARRIAPTARFLHASILDFRSSETFDAALSTFNSFAHLRSSTELADAFTNVHRALRRDAPFAFDLYMESAYQRRWHGCFEVRVHDQLCRIYPSYDPQRRLATNTIQLFQDSADSPEMLTLTQRCFSHAQVEEALRQSGFSSVKSFDANEHFNLSNDSGRAFFLALA
jgi:SAM-dependent methyltransferase